MMRVRRLLVVIGLLAGFLFGNSRAVLATPSLTILVGNSSAVSSNCTGSLATTAGITSPQSLAKDNAGNIYIADTEASQICELSPDGTISLFAGVGTNGYNGTGFPAINAQLNHPLGISAGPDGIYFSDGDNQLIRMVDNAGIIHDVFGVAGHGGLYAGSKMPYLQTPRGLDFDASGVLYVADSGNHLIRKIVGAEAIPVAGTNYYGYGGDEVPATTTGLYYPYDVKWQAGKMYIADMANNRVRMVDTAGVIHTVAGSGFNRYYNDDVLATNSAFVKPMSLSFDATGTMYVADFGDSRVRMVGIDGLAHTLVATATPYGVGLDSSGAVLIATGEQHTVLRYGERIVTQVPPVGPKVAAITPNAPNTNDNLLKRGVSISLTADSSPASRFEYGWAADSTSTKPTSDLQISTDTTGVLDYRATSPDSDWYIMARGIGMDGVVGNWSATTKVHTPKPPILIALGDSITAGHHRDEGETTTTCHDEAYSYAGVYAERWNATMPAAWRTPNNYLNFAQSGFATQMRDGSKIKGSVLTGGRDACGTAIQKYPIIEASSYLKANASSWNRLVISDGANDTNWTDVLQKIIQKELLQRQSPIPFQDHLSAAQCSKIVENHFDISDPAVVASITQGISSIIAQLRQADTSVRISWLGYYNIAGTGTNIFMNDPLVPASCAAATSWGLGALQAVIRAALPSDIGFVDPNNTLSGRGDLLQPLYVGQAVQNGEAGKSPQGWPHPTHKGAALLALLLAI